MEEQMKNFFEERENLGALIDNNHRLIHGLLLKRSLLNLENVSDEEFEKNSSEFHRISAEVNKLFDQNKLLFQQKAEAAKKLLYTVKGQYEKQNN